MKQGKRNLWMNMTAAMLCMACLMLGSAAMADGFPAQWHDSRLYDSVQFAWYQPDARSGYVDVSGVGGVTVADQNAIRVISKNASVWSRPQTNSTKLGSIGNGTELSCTVDGNGWAVEQNGFYEVNYKGKNGWVNSAYVVFAPLEIVLMESNVPAYCAPNNQSKKVGSLSKLTRYTVLGMYNDYYIISLREAAAFVPAGVRHYDTSFERNYHNAMTAYGTVNTKTALRTGPGEEYASVRDVKAGFTFTCLDVIDGWYLMQDSETNAYVYVNGWDASTDRGW